MLQFPYPVPDSPPPPMDAFEFAMLYLTLLMALGLCLPRPWFVRLFKIALPFMPDRLPRDDDEQD